MIWIRKNIERDKFFPIFTKVIKDVKYPKVKRTIRVGETIYRFLFRWIDENTCEINCYQKVK